MIGKQRGVRRQLLVRKKLLDAKRSENNDPCERTRVREGAEENMEVKTMAKLIECGLKIERGLKRRLTGKEGRDMEKKGGWKSIITTGSGSKGFGKFTNLRWI